MLKYLKKKLTIFCIYQYVRSSVLVPKKPAKMSSNASTSTPTSTMEIPGPSKLVRSVADQLPLLERPAPPPPKLQRSNAGDGSEVVWTDSEDEDEDVLTF